MLLFSHHNAYLNLQSPLNSQRRRLTTGGSE